MLDMKLEVMELPVADVDRARDFYTRIGWRLDADFTTGEDFRVIQVTPPGSPTSVIFGKGVTSAAPGSAQGHLLAVDDIEAARAQLLEAGVDVTEVFHDAGGVYHHAGTIGRVPGPAPEHASYGSFASFTDPDGNGWLLQEITERLPGRVDKQVSFSSADDLARALERAAAAHGRHEEETGQADAQWPDWYAQYLWDEPAVEPATV